MVEYSSNSLKSRGTKTGGEKAQKPEIKKVVTGDVVIKKRSNIKKIANLFVTEDLNTVKSYIFTDVLIPAIKKALSDIVKTGIDMMLYGNAGSSSTKSSLGGMTKVSYGGTFTNYSSNKQAVSAGATSDFNLDEIFLKTKEDADAVIETLRDVLDEYPVATVADLYEALQITAPSTYSNYGWTDLSSAYSLLTKNGYLLRLPRPRVIK